MKTTLIVAILLLATATEVAANSTSGFAKISTIWAEDWSAKKLDPVMAMYALEPVFLPTVGPRWEGTDAIRKNFSGVLATYNPHIVLHSIKSEASRGLAYDSGTYEETITPVKGGVPIAAKGSYLFIFQRQKNGAWKILEQAWTELEPVKL